MVLFCPPLSLLSSLSSVLVIPVIVAAIPSWLSDAVDMLLMLLSSSMPRGPREFSSPSDPGPGPLNSLFLSPPFFFISTSWAGIHLNCFMVVSGIVTHLFSQCLTLSMLCITLLMSSFLLCLFSLLLHLH